MGPFLKKIQLATLYLLIGVFSLLRFKMILHGYAVIVILLPVF